MTLGEFRRKTAHLSEDLDMMIEQTNEESRYGMAQDAEVRPVKFSDPEIPSREWPTIDCLIVTDEI